MWLCRRGRVWMGKSAITPSGALAQGASSWKGREGRAVRLRARWLAIREALAPCSDQTGKSPVSVVAAWCGGRGAGSGAGCAPPPRNAEQAESIIGSQDTAPGGTRAGNRSGRGEEKRRRRWHSESGGTGG